MIPILASVLVLTASGSAFSQSNYYYPQQQSESEGKGWFLPILKIAATEMMGLELKNTLGNFFRYLFRPANKKMNEGDCGAPSQGFNQYGGGGYNNGYGQGAYNQYGGQQPYGGVQTASTACQQTANAQQQAGAATATAASAPAPVMAATQPSADANAGLSGTGEVPLSAGAPGAGAQGLNALPQPALTDAAWSMTDSRMQQLLQDPLVALSVQRLASTQKDAAILEQISLGKPTAGVNPRFSIRTGEVFALQFVTSLPGRVTLTNTDSAGQRSSVPYDVVPEIDNRMPRNGGGIRMDPPTGMETLTVEFTPCVPAQMLNNPKVLAFQKVLAGCQSVGITPPGTLVADAGSGKALPAKASAKAMTFVEAPMEGIAVAAPAPGYQPGGALRFVIDVDHQPNI